MVSYQEAKEIALSYVEGTPKEINAAYETKDAYVFDNTEVMYTNQVPFVVTKKKGDIFNQFMYFADHNIAWDDKHMKELDFETGKYTGNPIDSDDEDEEEE